MQEFKILDHLSTYIEDFKIEDEMCARVNRCIGSDDVKVVKSTFNPIGSSYTITFVRKKKTLIYDTGAHPYIDILEIANQL